MLSDIPVALSGIASGANSTLRQVGSALGIAILGTVLFATLVSHSEDNIAAALPQVDPACQQLVVDIVDQTAGQVLPVLRDPSQAAGADFGGAAGSLTPTEATCFRDPAFLAALPSTARPVEDAFVDATRYAGAVATGFVLLGVLFSLLLPARPLQEQEAHEPVPVAGT